MTLPNGAGACAGFAVRSNLAFRYLRHGDGTPLEVTTGRADELHADHRLVLEWTPRPDNPLHARLYSDGTDYRLWIADTGWFGIQPAARRITAPEQADPLRREHRLWGLPTTLCALARGDFTLHAAAVEAHGSTLLLAAPTRFGKTTLAAAFHQAGFRVLSEDLTCIRLDPAPAVVPGPATLRLRRDIADRLRLDGVYEAGRLDDRVCLAIESSQRGDCAPVPLRAVVFLRPSDGAPRLEPASVRDGLADLWTLAFHLPTDADRARCFTGIASIARRVPLWNFHRALSLENLPASVARLAALCERDA